MDDLSKVIATYTPSDSVVELLQKTKIVLLCGITGAGKNTVATEILKDQSFTSLVTSTTRKPRVNDGIMEEHGKDYYFYEHDEAIEKINNGEYFEVALVHGLIYGSTDEEIKRIYESNKIAISDIDYQGIEYYKKYSPGALVIFLVPPSYEVWMQRLKMRHESESNFDEAWPVRRESAIRELEWSLASDISTIIVNDDFHQTCDIVRDIVGGKKVESDGRATAQRLLDRLRNN
ncbi:MAG: hypothetical protein ABIQ64_04640 [Candidatus Saccharimonadales bacterium]